MQADRTVRIGTRGAVFQIPPDRVTGESKLGPDLVMPPGQQLNLQEIIPVAGCNFPELQLSLQPPLPGVS